jgi:hypothetical protein
MGSGVAWGDFDNDGLDDLFVVSGGGSLDLPDSQLAPSVLYRNLGDGRFEKVKGFPELRIRGMAAAWGDYNNDGWLDLVVTGYDTILLFRNDHGHLVRDKTFPSPKGFWTGVSWGDYNRDGYLDLYVCGYVKYQPGEAGHDCQFDAVWTRSTFHSESRFLRARTEPAVSQQWEWHVHRGCERTGRRKSGRPQPERAVARFRWRWLARSLRRQ